MKHLYLEDLKEYTEEDIKEHISSEYAGDKSGFDYGNPSDLDKTQLREELDKYNILVAYESVGSYGCDSSSYFLLQRKSDGKLFEFSGSHCSCYGFEGQFDLQETFVDYLKSDKFWFCTGGYDDNSDENRELILKFMQEL